MFLRLNTPPNGHNTWVTVWWKMHYLINLWYFILHRCVITQQVHLLIVICELKILSLQIWIMMVNWNRYVICITTKFYFIKKQIGILCCCPSVYTWDSFKWLRFRIYFLTMKHSCEFGKVSYCEIIQNLFWMA